VGANGVGKSTVLSALNVFFGNQDGASTNVKRLSNEDFFQRGITEPIEIKVTFSDLSEAAEKDLSHYVRNNKLIVTVRAEFDGEKADIKQFASRLGMSEFAPFFEASKATDKKASIFNGFTFLLLKTLQGKRWKVGTLLFLVFWRVPLGRKLIFKANLTA